MNLRPPFPTVIDSSMMSAFTSCPYKAFLEYIHHWKSRTPNLHLHAGKAFAAACEELRTAFFIEKAPALESLARGMRTLIREYGDFDAGEESKSLDRMCGALEYYFTEGFPIQLETATPHVFTSGEHGIEFNFLEPLDVIHPVTHEPLLLSGRFDGVVDYAGGLFGLDDKTTKQLGPTWSNQWDLRAQFTAYCWAMRMANLPVQGMLVRGVSILKTKYDHAQAVTYRQEWFIDQWYEQLMVRLEAMKRMWLEGRFDKALDNACNEYGGCQFKQVCLSRDPQPWLETAFERRKWDPVDRVETIVTEEEVASWESY